MRISHRRLGDDPPVTLDELICRVEVRLTGQQRAFLIGAPPPISTQYNYVNLPPCYTFVGDIEPFYCETLNYVNQLKNAGVHAECDVYPGCWHAFYMLAPWKGVSRRAAAIFERKFGEALEFIARMS